MKKLLTILLVLISFSSFAQFEAGEYINSDTVKIDGVPLLLNTFKQGNLGGAGNIFYSTGASSQPASGSVNQVIGGNSLSVNYVPKWDGNKFANSNIYQDGNGNVGVGTTNSQTSLRLFTNNANETNLLTLQNFGNWGNGQTQNIVWKDQVGGITGAIGMQYDLNGNVDFKIHSLYNFDYKNSSITSFIVKGNGNVGIGTTTPLSKLSINGGLHVGGDSDAGDNNILADGTITGTQLISNIPTGTPPLVVASSTKVDSLNVGLFDGKKASDFQLKSDTTTFDATLSDLADSSAAIRALANTKAVVSGTNNYIMKKTGANTLGNSELIEKYGKIGINYTEPIAKLHVVESTILDSTQGAYQIITSEQGNAGNAFRNNQYLYRKSDGSNWITARWHDGISVDASYNVPGATTRTWWEREPAYGIQSWGDQGVTHMTINGGNVGIGTLTPAARIHSQSTGTQARLGYDENKYTDLSTGSTGNLTIDPTGDTVKMVGAVNSTGGFFKNGVEITGGGGGISNIGITVPTGLSVSPANLTANGTFAISYQPGYTYFTDIERLNYSNAYTYRLTSASGTSPLTLSLSNNALTGSLSSQLTSIGTLANSAGLLFNNGAGSFSYKTAPSGAIVGTTDSQALTNKSVNGVTLSTGAGTTNFLAGDGTYKAVSGSSKWTADTYGINYQSGNVGVGTASHSTSKLYVNGSITNNGSDRAALDLEWSNGESTIVSYNTGGGDGLYANSNGVAVRGVSSTTFGGVFGGLGCKAEKFYVTENLNTAPSSSTATGTVGEIRFTADYIYVCVATNTWKRTQISTW